MQGVGTLLRLLKAPEGDLSTWVFWETSWQDPARRGVLLGEASGEGAVLGGEGRFPGLISLIGGKNELLEILVFCGFGGDSLGGFNLKSKGLYIRSSRVGFSFG